MDLHIAKLQPRDKRYQLRLTTTELESLRTLATRNGIGIAELVRQMIAQVVDHVNKGQA